MKSRKVMEQFKPAHGVHYRPLSCRELTNCLERRSGLPCSSPLCIFGWFYCKQSLILKAVHSPFLPSFFKRYFTLTFHSGQIVQRSETSFSNCMCHSLLPYMLHMTVILIILQALRTKRSSLPGYNRGRPLYLKITYTWLLD